MIFRHIQLWDQKEVMKLLWEFRNVCNEIMFPDDETRYALSPAESWDTVFSYLLASSQHTCILALDEMDEYIWIVTINIIPQLRKERFYADIEEMYVKKKYRWTWCAQQLLDEACQRLRTNHPLVKQIRLSSWLWLDRAHAFYEKYWFEYDAKTYYYSLPIT